MSTLGQTSLYGGYLKNVQRYYDREPLVRASLQLLLSIFAVSFFSFVAIRPTLSTITTLLKKIDDQRLADQKLTVKLAQLAEAQQFLSDSGPELEALSQTAIPNGPEVKRLAQEIELSANQSGTLIIDLGFQATPIVGNRASLAGSSRAEQPTTAGREQFVTFNFSVGGGQGELIEFMNRLENLDRVITITNVSLGRPQTTGKTTYPLVATGRGTAYYLPVATPTPASDSLSQPTGAGEL